MCTRLNIYIYFLITLLYHSYIIVVYFPVERNESIPGFLLFRVEPPDRDVIVRQTCTLVGRAGQRSEINSFPTANPKQIFSANFSSKQHSPGVFSKQHSPGVLFVKRVLNFCLQLSLPILEHIDFDLDIDLDSPTEGAVVRCTFTSHTGWVSGVAWSPSNQHHFISGSYDMTMKLWDTRR